MKKRLLTTCFSLFFISSAFALGSCDAVSGIFGGTSSGSEGLTYELVDGSYTVTGRGTCEEGIIEIPAKYKGKAVTAIADNAFANDQMIGIVNIPASVTEIGASAFSGCGNLSDVTMGDAVTVIGERAFSNCAWLTNITLSDSLEVIEKSAFNGCRKLTALELPEGLRIISDNAFDYCDTLASLNFSTSLEVIGERAFSKCRALQEVNIPDGAPTEIQAYAFEECKNIKNVTLGNSVTYVGPYAFAEIKVRELVLGDSITSIGSNAFYGSGRLYKVTLGKSLLSIGDDAFRGCDTIREVYNRSNLTITVGSTDHGGVAQYALNVRTGNQPSKISMDEQGVLYLTDNGKKIVIGALLEDYTDIVLPDDVDEIAFEGLYNLDYLRSLDTGNGCKVIGENAVKNCYHLEKLIIGSSVQEIGRTAFYRARVLTTVIIRTKFENGSIAEKAFMKKRDEQGKLEKGSKDFEKVYFEGTSAEWENAKTKFDVDNDDMINNGSKTTIYFYSETRPLKAGNYWHYDAEGKPTVW